MRVRAAVVFGCFVAACRAFSSDPGSSDPPGSDGGADDSAAPVDGGGGDGGDGAPLNEGGGTWCATQGAHHTCLDFDDGRALPKLFDTFSGIGPYDGGAASIAIDTAKSTSAPAALLFEVPPKTNGLQLFASLFFPDAVNGVTCAFDVAFDAVPSGYIGTLIWVQLGGDYSIALGEVLELDDAKGSLARQTFPALGSGWAHVGLSINTRTGEASATLNGIVKATISLTGSPTTVTPTVNFGTLYPTADFKARYDNIVCDYIP